MKADEIIQKLQSGEMVLVKRETAKKMGLHPDRSGVLNLSGQALEVATPAIEALPRYRFPPVPTLLDSTGKWVQEFQGMNRHTPEYKEAVQHVKISYLTEQLGLDIKGIIHVGANDGYEMQWYQKMGIRHLMGIEPLPSAIKLFKEHYPDIPLGEFALGSTEDTIQFYVAPGDGQQSSPFREIGKPEYQTIYVPCHRWDSLVFPQDAVRGLDYDKYDCLVMDVQGYEMPALIGFGGELDYIECINLELSKEPIYEGGAPAAEVIAYLESRGFVRMSRIEDHNDVFFVRKGTPLKNLKINLGSGQRPFDSPWINVDIQDKWNPHVVADGTHMPMFPDGSAEHIVLHHVLEHFGCGEADAMLKECHRILRSGGSLIVTVPNMEELCRAWLRYCDDGDPKLDTWLFMINTYGAYMEDEADRHRWGYSSGTLAKTLKDVGFRSGKPFDFRSIPGSSIAKDWWILGLEAVK